MKVFKEDDSGFYDIEYFFGLEFRYFSGAHVNKLNIFDYFVGNVKGKRVLDLGCGGGLFSYLLFKKGAKVTGIDYSSSAVQFAQSRYPQVDFWEGTAYDLSRYGDGYFDIVTVIDLVEHLGDQSRALREIKRVLKPGGILVISTDLANSEWNKSILSRFIWLSMRFSKEGRAYRMIKEVESKIPRKKHYGDSHISLLSFDGLENLMLTEGFRVKKHDVYPLVRVGWRDLVLSFAPKKYKGEHQMIKVEK
jgi:ubiquinone/menaquinone biosynthesis C-methylase UbiE